MSCIVSLVQFYWLEDKNKILNQVSFHDSQTKLGFMSIENRTDLLSFSCIELVVSVFWFSLATQSWKLDLIRIYITFLNFLMTTPTQECYSAPQIFQHHLLFTKLRYLHWTPPLGFSQ